MIMQFDECEASVETAALAFTQLHRFLRHCLHWPQKAKITKNESGQTAIGILYLLQI